MVGLSGRADDSGGVRVAKKIDWVQQYQADADEVFAMLCDPEFVEHKCLASGSIEASADVFEEDTLITIVSRRVLPAKLPGFAKKFVGETVTLVETQRWTSDQDAGLRTATFVVDFGNNPIGFSGDVNLDPHPQGTTVQTVGSLKCTVPLVGGKIEGVAEEWIVKYLDKEQRVGTAWLNGER